MAVLGYDYVVRCPSCDSEVPGRDLVCSECGAFVYRDVPAVRQVPEDSGNSAASTSAAVGSVGANSSVGPPTRPRSSATGYPPGSGGPDYVYPTLQGWPGLGPDEPPRQYGYVPQPQPGSVSPAGAQVQVAQEELQRRGRVMGRWSIGLAILSLLIPLVGPVGIVTGYFAWRLGETRLGRIGVVASVVAMVAGVGLAMLVAPAGTG